MKLVLRENGYDLREDDGRLVMSGGVRGGVGDLSYACKSAGVRVIRCVSRSPDREEYDVVNNLPEEPRWPNGGKHVD